MSSSDDSSSGGVFHYEKRTFQSKKKPRQTPQYDSDDDSDNDSFHLKIKERDTKKKKKAENNESDDSSVELVTQSAAAVAAVTSENKTNSKLSKMLEDSDDEVFVVPTQTRRRGRMSKVEKEMNIQLAAAQQARSNLEHLKRMNKDYVDLDQSIEIDHEVVILDDSPPSFRRPQAFSSHTATTYSNNNHNNNGISKQDIGKKINLKVRLQDGTTYTIPIGEKETFHKLEESFRSKHSLLDLSAKVTFLLDGDNLAMNQTPQNEDLEGGEIIDAVIKGGTATSKSKVTTTYRAPQPHPKVNIGKKIKLKMRLNGNDKDISILTIGDKEKFERLLEQYKQKYSSKIQGKLSIHLELDGDKINLQRTSPEDEGLEGEEIIDVVAK